MMLSETACQDRNSLLRAFAGALFGALPLLFTMEMWWYGETVAASRLLLWLLATGVVVALCLLFGGFRHGHGELLALDLPIALGAAVFAAALTLLLVGQISFGETPLDVAARIIAVEAVPCAIGAGLALTQLRPRQRFHEVDRRLERLPQDHQKVLGTLVGAVFFAFNTAPTEEVRKMAMEAEPWNFPLMVLFSLAATYMIVFLADFADRPPHYREGALGNPLAETLVSYLVSLVVSYAFLVAFGHISPSTPINFQVSAAALLAYVTSIGGAAGRVLVAR